MEKLSLLLRQRKMLNILLHRDDLITGASLARMLDITTRTVRSDVAVINRSLEPYQARIESVRSKGYRFQAGDPSVIKTLMQADTELLTQEGRLRYLAFQLCLADEPLGIYDLEDEMFVSYTTLENDIQRLREKYVLAEPNIRLDYRGRELSFEPDERKRRHILNALFHEHWNYNGRSNAYYDFDYLDKSIMTQVLVMAPEILQNRGVMMEDASLVRLELSCVILVERLRSGHVLPPAPPFDPEDPNAAAAAEELSEALEAQFRVALPQQERDELCRLLTAERVIHFSDMDLDDASDFFSPQVRETVATYIAAVRDAYRLDFSGDQDFLLTLHHFFRYLTAPRHMYSSMDRVMLLKDGLRVELELAWLARPIVREYLGREMTEAELLHLANCVSGAMTWQTQSRPELKIRTVICCHLNMSAAWAIKRKVLSRFLSFIDITALIPVNLKRSFDFSGTDLVLSTVHKPIAEADGPDLLEVSAEIGVRDIRAIDAYVRQKLIMKLFPAAPETLQRLLEDARWQEGNPYGDYMEAVLAAAQVIVDSGAAEPGFVADVLEHERLSPHVLEQGIVFIPSIVEARETMLSIVVFPHRLLIEKCKVRAVAVGSFRPEDRSLLFHCGELIRHRNRSVPSFGSIKTKEDLFRLLTEGEPFTKEL